MENLLDFTNSLEAALKTGGSIAAYALPYDKIFAHHLQERSLQLPYERDALEGENFEAPRLSELDYDSMKEDFETIGWCSIFVPYENRVAAVIVTPDCTCAVMNLYPDLATAIADDQAFLGQPLSVEDAEDAK